MLTLLGNRQNKSVTGCLPILQFSLDLRPRESIYAQEPSKDISLIHFLTKVLLMCYFTEITPKQGVTKLSKRSN